MDSNLKFVVKNKKFITFKKFFLGNKYINCIKFFEASITSESPIFFEIFLEKNFKISNQEELKKIYNEKTEYIELDSLLFKLPNINSEKNTKKLYKLNDYDCRIE